jgi:serine/threonine protein kinase
MPDSSGGYKLLGQLGKGKFAMVYKAEKDGQLYALKKVQVCNLSLSIFLSSIAHYSVSPCIISSNMAAGRRGWLCTDLRNVECQIT